MFEVWT